MASDLVSASFVQLVTALGKRIWAKTVLRWIIRIYGAAFVGIALSYLVAKKKEIKGKTVLITGAGGGLGRSLVLEFAKRGSSRLVIWDINTDALEETSKQVKAAHSGVEVIMGKVDISKREAIYEACDALLAKVGFVDIVINNAGILGGKPFLDLDDRRIQLLFDVNTMANFWMAKKFLPGMIARNDGHYVVVASVAAFFPTANSTDYCASKAAAKMFIDSLRMELKCAGKTGVKTLCVCPAGMKTALFKDMQSIPGLAPAEPADIAIEVADAVRSQKEIHITHFPMTHMGIANFGCAPVWFTDFCNSQTAETVTTVDLTQANAVFAKMEEGKK